MGSMSSRWGVLAALRRGAAGRALDLPHATSFRLTSTSLAARATPCPADPARALVVVLDGSQVPVAEQYLAWSDELAHRGFTALRTGALSARQALQAEAAGLDCAQELELLQLDAPLPAASSVGGTTAPVRLRRLRRHHLAAAADIDRVAFGERWWLDAGMLADVCTATPRHRARVAVVQGSVGGSLISGRSGSTGYVQRLSVHPSLRRCGIARTLLADALTWMRRSGTTRVYVNTHIDNDAALALYHSVGFRSLPERLRVFEGPTRR